MVRSISTTPAVAWPRSFAATTAFLLFWAVVSGQSLSQEPREGTEATGSVAAPIQCWWRVSKSAVRVGERFLLVLTCSVRGTNQIKVIPDFAEIDPGSLKVAPFEVVDGHRYEEIETGSERFFQYQYTLRLIAEDYFGKDVPVPALNVVYNLVVETGGVMQKGGDRIYVLPPLPMRIASLVPATNSDIRDVSTETFGAIEAREYRSTVMRFVASLLLAISLVLLVVALFGFLRRIGKVRVVQVLPAPSWLVLVSCLAELKVIRSDVESGGWSAMQVSRALRVARIASGAAIGHPSAQMEVAKSVTPDEGQFLVHKGLVRRKRLLLSSSLTSAALDRRLAMDDQPAGCSVDHRTVDELRKILMLLNASRYGRHPELDNVALDRIPEALRSILWRLLRAGLWPAALTRLMRRVKAPVGI